MSKHTPGPWYRVSDEVFSDRDLTDRICDVDGGSGRQYHEDTINEECLANALLITAAPDMFNTLHDILIKADRQRIQLGALLCIHPETSAIRTALTENALILNAARAAIKKATTPE